MVHSRIAQKRGKKQRNLVRRKLRKLGLNPAMSERAKDWSYNHINQLLQATWETRR